MTRVPIIAGLHEIAGDYDSLICDVWGVVHNGITAYTEAVNALREFRRKHGPVILLTNAPRPVADVVVQFRRFKVPKDCYDGILTSGSAARMEMERRAQTGRLSFYFLGPERDEGLIRGLDADRVPVEKADVVLCTGLFDDTVESPDDYADVLNTMRSRGLPLLCANPDIVVMRGTERVWCAGALAKAYEKLGGDVLYFGKPYPAVYTLARQLSDRPMQRPLAIGDGLMTDIKGANGAGIDALFVAHGIHAEELDSLAPENVDRLCQSAGVQVRAAAGALVW